MKISKKTQYALRALIEFTHHHGRPPLLRRDIAQKQHIPLQFLEHILLTLKHAGLLASHRGVRGGYSLIKQPRQITLGQVIRIMDGPLAPIPCVSRTAYQKCRDCPYAKTDDCPLQDVMRKVRNAIVGILDHYTLKDFTEMKAFPRA
ncbi:MAG: Rrf2 family transcriptional regulator [Nitrospirae bacterium]|nr:Rrf2 family transcriptional regulator [Nitrospirota bacterium]